jgi:hypothetical protein
MSDHPPQAYSPALFNKCGNVHFGPVKNNVMFAVMEFGPMCKACLCIITAEQANAVSRTREMTNKILNEALQGAQPR